jgi:hypothetical protein
MAAPIRLARYASLAAAESAVCGVLLIILLALPRGPVESRYGARDQFILIDAKK